MSLASRNLELVQWIGVYSSGGGLLMLGRDQDWLKALNICWYCWHQPFDCLIHDHKAHLFAPLMKSWEIMLVEEACRKAMCHGPIVSWLWSMLHFTEFTRTCQHLAWCRGPIWWLHTSGVGGWVTSRHSACMQWGTAWGSDEGIPGCSLLSLWWCLHTHTHIHIYIYIYIYIIH